MLGAGIAGLVAARVLSDAFDRVCVVERDPSTSVAPERRGVPQGRHIHALAARGLDVLEELFPGLTAELTEAGAPRIDLLADNRPVFSGHRLCRTASGVTSVCLTRGLLEATLRRRVQALPGVRFLDRYDIGGLVSDGGHRRRVVGVRALGRRSGSAEQELAASLVVDATGRGSRSAVWLENLGYGRVPEERVTIGLSYTSALLQPPPGGLGDANGILIAPTPQHPRGAALQTVEGGRWLVTLIGVLGQEPALGRQGFLEYAATVRPSDVHDAIGAAEFLTEPVRFRFPASRRRHYQRLAAMPEGLVLVGDAVCSFNPIYGQGMAVAAMEGLALRDALARGTVDSARFQRSIARLLDAPWEMSTGGDLAFPGVTGRRTLTSRIGNAWVPRVHAAAASDPVVSRTFVRVAGGKARPEALFSPALVARVLRARLGGMVRVSG